MKIAPGAEVEARFSAYLLHLQLSRKNCVEYSEINDVEFVQEREFEMSEKEKDLRDEVKAEAKGEVETEGEAEGEAETEVKTEDEAGVELEAEVEVETEDEAVVEMQAQDEAEVETEGEAGVEAPAEREAAEPAGTALATKTETGLTSNERIWAALAHASVLLTFILGVTTGGLAVIVGALVPLIIWLAFHDKSRFVAFHAMQATVFQLASVAAWIGLLIVGVTVLIPAWIVTILLLVVLIGFLLLPLVLVLTVALPAALVVMPLAVLVYGLYGAFEVYAGRDFRYWLVADWIEKRGVKSPSTELAAQPASQ